VAQHRMRELASEEEPPIGRNVVFRPTSRSNGKGIVGFEQLDRRFVRPGTGARDLDGHECGGRTRGRIDVEQFVAFT
jgi:hypothetical protein